MRALVAAGVVSGAALAGVLAGAIAIPRLVPAEREPTAELVALRTFCIDVRERTTDFMRVPSGMERREARRFMSDSLLSAALDMCARRHIDLAPEIRCWQAGDLACLAAAFQQVYDAMPDEVVRNPRTEITE